MTPDQSPRRSDLPDWFPPWAVQLADLYFSGTTAAFVLHSNTQDLFRVRSDSSSSYAGLAESLAERLLARWALVLHYALGRGVRAFAGRDEQRLKEMVTLANRKIGDLSALPRDPATAFAALDRLVRANIMAGEADRISGAGVVDQAAYLFSAAGPGRLRLQSSSGVATTLHWARRPPD